MKNLKIKLALVLLAMTVLLLSCNEQDPVTIDPEAGLVEVSFDVENYITGLEAKDGKLYETILCNDTETPDFAYVKINGTAYELDLVTLPTASGGMQTEVLKLPPGTYTIEEFAVYSGTPNNNDDSDDTVLFASPEHASDYVTNWGMIGVGLGSTPFTVEAFKKAPVQVDVLCYVPSAYVDFGFSWMQFDKFQAKKIYFFGDVCTKFWEDWRDYNDANNPYLGAINGYDFPAAFTVDVYKGLTATGVPAVSGTYTPSDYVGLDAEPLCIEYIDELQSVADNYTFVISLIMPDSSESVIHTGTFTDANWSKVTPDADTFGGDDGVFDFVVGNCSYEGNNANEELPAWIPVATEGEFKVSGNVYPSTGGYLTASFRGLNISDARTLANGTDIPMWCAAEVDKIYRNNWYPADFYSSLGANAHTRAGITVAKVAALNWIANNLDADAEVVQKAIWHIMGTEPANTYATTALANSSFVPSVGDYAIIFADAKEGVLNSDGVMPEQGGPIQLMVVRVDP